MSNTDIQKVNEQGIEIWNREKADKIRQIFAPNLSNQEFQMFWGLGKSLGANPFTGEIWAVKYDKNKSAQIFLGRDFYRKKAQEQPNYDGHIVDAVYSNDNFEVDSGVPKHSYNLTDRGKLLGAYCVVHKEDISKPFYVYVELDEYDKGQSTWNEKPATMIKKVAEAQALRGAYQGVFRGTYDESEQWTKGQGNPAVQPEASDRQGIDVDIDQDNGQQEEVQDVEPEDQSGSVETQANSANGNKQAEQSTDKEAFDELLADVNELGKQLYKSQWFSKSKEYLPSDAEYLTDLDMNGLENVKAALEDKAKVEA